MSKQFKWCNSSTLSICIALSAQISFADWSSFRNGGASQVAFDLPTTWSPTQNIAWQRELIGYGQSTPVVHDGKIYLAAVEGAMKDNCIIQCLD